MSREDILKRLEKIKELAYDSEVAHVLEDELYVDFIRSMDNELGKLVLTVKDIKFERWYA